MTHSGHRLIGFAVAHQAKERAPPKALLKDDLAILFATDLSPAIRAVETLGASNPDHCPIISEMRHTIATQVPQRVRQLRRRCGKGNSPLLPATPLAQSPCASPHRRSETRAHLYMRYRPK